MYQGKCFYCLCRDEIRCHRRGPIRRSEGVFDAIERLGSAARSGVQTTLNLGCDFGLRSGEVSFIQDGTESILTGGSPIRRRTGMLFDEGDRVAINVVRRAGVEIIFRWRWHFLEISGHEVGRLASNCIAT